MARSEGQLHGVANGAVCELQIRAVGAQSSGCEYRQLGLELFPKLSEQREMNTSRTLQDFNRTAAVLVKHIVESPLASSFLPAGQGSGDPAESCPKVSVTPFVRY